MAVWNRNCASLVAQHDVQQRRGVRSCVGSDGRVPQPVSVTALSFERQSRDVLVVDRGRSAVHHCVQRLDCRERAPRNRTQCQRVAAVRVRRLLVWYWRMATGRSVLASIHLKHERLGRAHRVPAGIHPGVDRVTKHRDNHDAVLWRLGVVPRARELAQCLSRMARSGQLSLRLEHRGKRLR